MKKSRLITAFLSALTAASMLSATASAGYIPEGYTPVFDITPAMEGEIRREYMTEAEIGHIFQFYYDKNGERVTGRSLLYVDYSAPDDLGYNMKMVKLKPETGEFDGMFTGFTRSSRGRRYYSSGERIYGWYKIGNYWYHFDENGYADTGRTKICGAYYTFDEKGRWLNKVSKDGLAPKDFKLSLESYGGMSAFDTDGYIFYGEDYDGEKYTADVKFPARDRQIFYCMLLESGFADGKDYDFGGSYLYEKEDEIVEKSDGREIYMSATEPETVYVLKYTCDGKSGSVKFGYDSKQITHIDKTCFNAYRFADGIGDYRNSYLYKKFPQPEGVDWVTLC